MASANTTLRTFMGTVGTSPKPSPMSLPRNGAAVHFILSESVQRLCCLTAPRLLFIHRAFDLGRMIFDVDLGSLRFAQHLIQFGYGAGLQVRPALQEIGAGAFLRG